MKPCIAGVVFFAGVCGFIYAQGTAAMSPQPTAVQARKVSQEKRPVPADTSLALIKAPAVDSAKAAADSAASMLSAIRVVTEPPGAQVLLDDSARCETPCSISGISRGTHSLTLKKVGCYVKKAEISVDSTGAQEFSYTLLRPAFLRVTSVPDRADVAFDGKKEGETPYENDKVKPGDHSLRISRVQYQPVERTVTVGSGTVDTVHIVLEHTAAYKDSVAAALLAQEHARKERFTMGIVSAVFVLFALALGLFEAVGQ